MKEQKKGSPKQHPPKQRRMVVTAAVKILYLQAIEKRLGGLTPDEQHIIASVFEERFPVLKQDAKKMQRTSFRRGHPYLYGVLWLIIIGLILSVLVLLTTPSYSYASAESDIQAASGLQTWEQELLKFQARLTQEELRMFQQMSDAEKRATMAENMQRLAEQDTRQQAGQVYLYKQDANNAAHQTHQARNVNAALMQQIDAVRKQAKDVEFRAALTNKPQTHVNGSSVIQAAPREIVMTAQGPGLSDRRTQITIVQPRALPTPVPVKAPQKTQIQTSVNGIDKIETRAVLPQLLTVDQLDAVSKIADNGTLIAQQRFGLEQYTVDQNTQLEALRIVKSFVLWGFLASIPFLGTCFLIGKSIVKGVAARAALTHEYKLKELEFTEHAIYDRVKQGGRS